MQKSLFRNYQFLWITACSYQCAVHVPCATTDIRNIRLTAWGQILSSWLGDIVDSGLGLSYRLASLVVKYNTNWFLSLVRARALRAHTCLLWFFNAQNGTPRPAHLSVNDPFWEIIDT